MTFQEDSVTGSILSVRQTSYRLACLILLIMFVVSWNILIRSDPPGLIFARPLEARFAVSPPEQPVTGIIALGGNFERVAEAVKLAHRHPSARFVLTGAGEEDAHEFVRAQGFPEARLIIESRSHNTYENAIFTAALTAPQGAELWILVTSASHMPRAVGTFRKAGFTVHPWPTICPSEPSLSLQGGMHEWFGLIGYWVAGHSDSLFPGPR